MVTHVIDVELVRALGVGVARAGVDLVVLVLVPLAIQVLEAAVGGRMHDDVSVVRDAVVVFDIVRGPLGELAVTHPG